MKYKALLLMACVAALAMLAMPYMTPQADAASTFASKATCVSPTSAVATWEPTASAGYFLTLSSPSETVPRLNSVNGLAIPYTGLVPGAEYTLGIDGSQEQRSETTFTCARAAPPAFTASVACGHAGAVTVSWQNAPAGAAGYTVGVKRSGGSYALTDGSGGSITPDVRISYDTPYEAVVVARFANNTQTSTGTAFTCPNLAPTVSAGPDQTVSVNWHIYLSGTVRDDNLDPVTYEWTCGPADLDIAIEGSTSTYAKVILPANYAGTATCTLTATDGSLTSSDTMTITVQSSGGGSAPQDQTGRDQTGQGNPPPSDVPDGTPDRTDQGGQTNQGSTRTTGGGSGGTGGGGSFFFIPSSSPSRTQSEPEPEPEQYQPTITNGTIPFVKFRAVPLNGTYWNGTTTTPFQCDIEPTGHGHVNMTGLTYLGMEPYHIRTSNITHANATDTTPAVYNMTVHAITTYNMTELGSHGALYHVSANDIVWSIYPDTIPVFRDLFDDTDILAITQYGNVHWTAADGACRAP